MAFGKSLKAQEQTKTEKAAVNTETVFVNQKLLGKRIFRLLPLVNVFGELVDEDGGISERGVTADEIRWYEVWFPCNVGQETPQDRKIIIGREYPWDNNNPLWKHLKERRDSGEENVPKARQRFAVNVLDRSMAIITPDGEVAYSIDDKTYMTASGNVVSGTPKPLNRIHIFEGSAGKENGDHQLQHIYNFFGNVQDQLTAEILMLHEFDIIMNVKDGGKKPVNGKVIPVKTRSMTYRVSEASIPVNLRTLPRWDIETWSTPYPNEMLQRLIDGENYNELIKEFNIQLFPQRIASAEEASFDD